MIINLPSDAHRVSLRRLDRMGRASDVVGHLVAANDEYLVVLPEDRPEIWIPRGEARNIRRVPERTVLPASPPEALERMLDRTWPGTRRARLGGWVLRQGSGRTKRANSVLVAGDPGLSVRDAVAEAERWYGARPVLQVVVDDPAAAELVGNGYEAVALSLVMVARIDDLRALALPGALSANEPGEGFVGLWRDGGIEPGALVDLTAAPARYVWLPGVAAGRVAPVGDWAVLSCIEVAAGRRGEGLGRAITRALVAEAAASGARFVALQVEEHNTVARRLYEGEGFVEHHRYCYLVPTA